MSRITPKDASWYEQNMPGDIAGAQSAQLGINQPTLYKMYEAWNAANPTAVARKADAPWANQFYGAPIGATSGGGAGVAGIAQSGPLAPSGAYGWIQDQVNTRKAQSYLNQSNAGQISALSDLAVGPSAIQPLNSTNSG